MGNIPSHLWGQQHSIPRDDPNDQTVTQQTLCYHCVYAGGGFPAPQSIVMISGTNYCLEHARTARS